MDNDFIYVKPADIERESFRIIGEELSGKGIVLKKKQEPYIKRCIHTSADFSYATTLAFSRNATSVLEGLLREHASVICDTHMALSGINKTALERAGCRAYCFMTDDRVKEMAGKEGTTRAAAAVSAASHIEGRKIFCIGNAPTALIELNKLYKEGRLTPDFVIGVPVGFVNVVYAKELIINSDIPYIVNRGRKGGSPIAACLINAALYRIENRQL